MVSLLNALLVAILLLNLFALSTSRISALIQAAAIQGILLGAMPVLAHHHLTVLTGTLGAATILVKGSLIPQMLRKALRDAQIKREIEPIISFMPSMLLGALGTALAIGLTAELPLAHGQAGTLIVPSALATVFTGFLLLTSRVKAISQVIGYLILENGIFIFGLLLLQAVPFLVELGVLLDLLVGIFVISIILHHISRAFDSLDTRRLSALKE